ncbi:hypothetical protein FOC4_g10000754 [Fusarium odoratissimum]|uniref:Xylanolytic transcriptional activator regulatory domain-containing protein n=1 Tax=Fusarium oxysporum f. sp. cubense (strain race 4) TaxID=2502994 RepID=N1SAZ3_FUSC4|nr:hypothetical protein FOC4_g10000754 [Fusarium odoratissimum]
MAESGVALGVSNPKVSKMRGSARRRHRTPARYSFQPVIAAKSLGRASCSQIKAQQEVLYSRVRQDPDGRKQRRANDAELENSGARAGIRVRVETAGLRTLCLPASHESTGMYPVSYVQGLEQRVAGLQGRLDQQTAKSMTQENPESGSNLAPNLQANIHPDLQSFTGHLDAFYMPSVPSQGNSFDLLTYQADNLFSISQQPPADEANYSTDAMRSLDPSMAAVVTNISVREGASFFQTYFEIIHPRYPFLDVEECSTAYIKWKAGEIATCGNNAWSTCLLKLVPMLLHAFHELHGESTERVVHIVGVAMRFAIFNGFHRLTNDGSYEIEMKIKAWWCIYCLDKVVAITLRIPPYPLDEWIDTPAYRVKHGPQFFMPWAVDAPGSSDGVLYTFDLRYFAHMCKIRRLHSEILTLSRQVDPGSIDQSLRKLLSEIDGWAKSKDVFASRNSHPNAEGHASPLGVVYVAHMTRVVLYSSVPLEPGSENTDKLLQACCDSCATFRALQKRKHLPKHWFDVGVVMVYILWRRSMPVSKVIDRAIRDCTAVLSIFADRSQKVDIYRDCMELLASSISRISTPGTIDTETRQELNFLLGQIEENSLASHVHAKLSEMCKTSIAEMDT